MSQFGLADLCIAFLDNRPIGVVEYIGKGYADMAQTPEGDSSITGDVLSLIVLKFAGKMLKTTVFPKKAEVKAVESGSYSTTVDIDSECSDNFDNNLLDSTGKFKDYTLENNY